MEKPEKKIRITVSQNVSDEEKRDLADTLGSFSDDLLDEVGKSIDRQGVPLDNIEGSENNSDDENDESFSGSGNQLDEVDDFELLWEVDDALGSLSDDFLDEVGKNIEEESNFELLWEVDWSSVEYERNKKIVKWKWEVFDMNTKEWSDDLVDELTDIMRSSEMEKGFDVLGQVFNTGLLDAIEKRFRL